MGNMSYCRFENTERDLRDCAAHILDKGLSPSEADARLALIDICADILTSLQIDVDLDAGDYTMEERITHLQKDSDAN